MNSIEINNLNISSNKETILKEVNLSVRNGEILCLLGSSGVGKTTLLNAIASIKLQNLSMSGKIKTKNEETNAGTLKDIGYVFQDLALFPHMTVFENISFPLEIRKTRKSVIEEKVSEILTTFQILDKKYSKIQHLSGGEKQRVALGRTLITNPSIVLMDEPLKGLDPLLKKDFLVFLKKIQRKNKFTLVYVTHDSNEAFYCADRIAFMSDGEIVQLSRPITAYSEPQSIEIARFLGDLNIINGEALSMPKITNHHEIKFVAYRPENAIVNVYLDSEKTINQNDYLNIPGKLISTYFASGRTNTVYETIYGPQTVSTDFFSNEDKIIISIKYEYLLFFDKNEKLIKS